MEGQDDSEAVKVIYVCYAQWHEDHYQRKTCDFHAGWTPEAVDAWLKHKGFQRRRNDSEFSRRYAKILNGRLITALVCLE